jgi:hypothetical protein
MNAGWDIDLLAIELGDLQGLGFDLALTGFGEDELLALMSLGNAGLTDPDDTPELPETPVSARGDVWIMGRHRLICGDSTDAGDVARVLDGVKPHLCTCDPPYGVNYDPAWRRKLGVGNDLATGKVLNDDRADWREAWALFPGDVMYVWHGALHAAAVAESLESVGFVIRSQVIWDKTRLVIGRGDYHWQHEPCWYAVRKGKKGHWSGDRKQTTVWAIPHRKSASGHGTQKPVECMKRIARLSNHLGGNFSRDFNTLILLSLSRLYAGLRSVATVVKFFATAKPGSRRLRLVEVCPAPFEFAAIVSRVRGGIRLAAMTMRVPVTQRARPPE